MAWEIELFVVGEDVFVAGEEVVEDSLVDSELVG